LKLYSGSGLVFDAIQLPSQTGKNDGGRLSTKAVDNHAGVAGGGVIGRGNRESTADRAEQLTKSLYLGTDTSKSVFSLA
jgi:hypothetical protein